MQKIELIFCVHTYFTFLPINLILFIISYQIVLRIELSGVGLAHMVCFITRALPAIDIRA